MFSFLKQKLKDITSKFSKEAEEASLEKNFQQEKKQEEPKEEQKVIEEPVKTEVKEKAKEIKAKKEPEIPEKQKEKKAEIQKKQEVKKEEKEQNKSGFVHRVVRDVIPTAKPLQEKGFFSKLKEKITTKQISEEKFESLFHDLELALIESNVAFEVIEKIKEDLKKSLVNKPLKGNIEDLVKESLRNCLMGLFSEPKIDLVEKIKAKKEKPFVIVFFGTNGAGKTTTISKIANLLLKNNFSVILGAGDCFRKGSIEQLEEWGKRLNVKVIKHDYGADMTAVCFDTVSFAKAHNIDVVLLDTAGRQYTNKNLMEELNKLSRVINPDLKIFVAESIVGNDGIYQAKNFNEKIGINGIILTKADVDERGGAMISIEYITHKPIMYLGVGQNLTDLKEFNKEEIINQLNL